MPDQPYTVATDSIPDRMTGVYVRALRGGIPASVDIAELDAPSLLRWLRSRGGENSWAENIVGLLLGHGPLVIDADKPSAALKQSDVHSVAKGDFIKAGGEMWEIESIEFRRKRPDGPIRNWIVTTTNGRTFSMLEIDAYYCRTNS